MIHFTKLLAGLFIVGAACFSACHSSETTPTNRVVLRLHQSARIGADVTVRADSIQDSRCPINANCIWAGQANVKLVLSDETDSTAVRLVLGSYATRKRLDSTNVSLAKGAYRIILQDVNPYPGSGTTGQTQTAIVQVTKL